MGRRRQPFRHVARLPVAEIALPARAAPAPEAVQRLAQTLRRQGLRDPVLVAGSTADAAGAAAATGSAGQDGKPAGAQSFRLVVGLRRLLAARVLRWKELDAVVLDESYAAELAVIERLQAGDYESFELTETLRALQQRCGWTQVQLGAAIGRNRDFVTGLLALSAIAPDVRAYLAQHQGEGRALSTRHLRYIGRAAPQRQLQVAQEILAQGLSVKALEQRLRQGARARSYIKVRPLRQPGAARGPRTTKEWRRYYRKLNTDLRRIDEQERHELRRIAETIDQARQRQALLRKEARVKRQTLSRELRRAKAQLERRGEL